MLSDFPASHGQQREDLILDIVKNQQNRISYKWVELDVSDSLNKLILYVMEDALKIDGVRVNVSAKTEQHVADFMGASLLTSKICDLIWHKATIKINPIPRKISSTTKDMIAHSSDVDNKIGNKTGLVSTVGKDWILDNKTLGKNLGCNYGWHYDTGEVYQGIKGNTNSSLLKNPVNGKYWYMIQSRGTKHDQNHTDYSQICRLMTRECLLNGKKTDILDVFKDAICSKLINVDRILKVTRISSVQAPNTTIII